MPLKILFIGDVVGSPGRKIVGQVLPRLIPRWGLGLVVCNAENAAGGSGLTLRSYEELVDAGAKVDADSPYGTALFFAAEFGNAPGANFLMDHGASVTGTRPDRINCPFERRN